MRFTLGFTQAAAALLVIANCPVPNAMAQQVADGHETPAPGEQLESIVVTAEKRSESLQRVPLSISAFTAGTLESNRIESSAQLQTVVPGLVYGSSGGFATPYIRGIGSDIATVGAEPGVATYVDGVYIANPAAVNMNLVDVDRVEVVKGPQGTLYGRNAVGGAVNIITRQPGQASEGQVSAGFGNHNQYELAGFVSGGVTSALALGAYLNFLERDPLVTNLAAVQPPGVPSHKQDVSLRVKGVLTLSDATDFTLSAHYSNARDPDAWSFRQVQPNAPGLLAGGRTSYEPLSVYENFPSYQTSRMYDVTLKGKTDLAFAQLVSITGYQDFSADQSVDYDGTDAPVLGFAILPNFTRQFSEEVQLVSLPSSPLKWIAGLYYSDEKSGGRFDIVPGALDVKLNPNLGVKSEAVFAEITAPISDQLDFTVGARYTHDRKTVSSVQLIPAFGLITPQPSQAATFNSPTWKAAFNYRFTPDVMAYASYTRGFQDGAFNAVDTGAPPVKPETIDAYEVGLKSDYLHSRLRVNLAAFAYNFKDLQVQVNDNSGAAASLQNAGAARVRGAEISVESVISQQLMLHGGLTYLNSQYQHFTDYSGWIYSAAGGNQSSGIDVSGNSVVYAPDLTLSLGMQYTQNLGARGKLTLDGTYYHSAAYNFDPQQFARQNAYDIVNASISWVPSEKYRVSLWGENLGNKNYLVWSVASADGLTNKDAPGRLYGLKVSYYFGR